MPGGAKALFSYINLQVTASIRRQNHAKCFIWGQWTPCPPAGTCLRYSQNTKVLHYSTCTLASLKSNLIANSSLINTSGYCVFSKALSNWCSWYVVNVVRLLRIFLGLSPLSAFTIKDSSSLPDLLASSSIFCGSWSKLISLALS